jgi:chromosome segregation ATPase
MTDKDEVQLMRIWISASEDMLQFYRDRCDAQDRQITAHKSTIEAQARAIKQMDLEAHAAQTSIDSQQRRINDLKEENAALLRERRERPRIQEIINKRWHEGRRVGLRDCLSGVSVKELLDEITKRLKP